MAQKYQINLVNENTTARLAQCVAQFIKPPFIIYLSGDLGAAKTTFSRYFIQARGHSGPVKSPTFTIVEPYELGDECIFHFDCYRIQDPEELEYLGIRDYITSESICLIEWPERAANVLPPCDIHAMFRVITSTERSVIWHAVSAQGQIVLQQLKNQWEDK
ncbi:MAG: tRNA (adenosine(37)-N6)-threonylcarbamoyltransferase complex ATPase subunit type 1 TsaE [Gammaproteobacteria bacterium]